VHAEAAGDGEVVAGDVAGGIRGEEGDGFGDVTGYADAPERNALGPGLDRRTCSAATRTGSDRS